MLKHNIVKSVRWRFGVMGLWEGGRVLDRASLVKRPVWAFLQTRDRHIEMSSPANRSLEAF